MHNMPSFLDLIRSRILVMAEVTAVMIGLTCRPTLSFAEATPSDTMGRVQATAAAQSTIPAQPKAENSPADTLRLEQVIKEVVEHNDRVAAARYMEQSSRDKVGPAGAWDDPMFMLGVVNLPTSFNFRMDDMTMKMLALSQRVPYAGEKGLKAKAARYESAASTEERRDVELELTTAAQFAYFDLYYQQRNLEDLKRQLELMEQMLASATAKLRVNEAGQDEVLAAQADVWRLESMVFSAEAEVTSSSTTLNSLRGLDARTAVPVLAAPVDSQVPEGSDQWLTAASENYPPLKRLKYMSEAYAFSAAASRRMRWPMLDLYASYGLREAGPLGPRDNMVGFQAALSLPIFEGRQQGQMARSMQAMQKSSEAEATQLRLEVQANLISLHDRAQRLSKSLRLYREQIIPASEDAYRSALAGYMNNRTSFIALLTYAGSIYRDRVTANQLANELARTMAEAKQYTTDASAWSE